MFFPRFKSLWRASILSFFLAVGLASNAEAGPYAGLVVEVESERVLYTQNAEELRHPASLTKMMTLYLVFEALSRGQLSLSDRLRVSSFAVSRPPSKLGLRTGETISVEEGILALVTQSANDAATVLAEALGDTEPDFAAQMTQKARQLGMSNTVFHNASGLPDPNQVTSAWDMFRLAKALLKNFPQYYPYFSTESFQFRNRSFHNHNHLLNTFAGADGIKTGYVNASGFNLVASARRNGVRLIGVVFGGNTHARRDAHMRSILDAGFAKLDGREPNQRMAGIEADESRVLLRRPPPIERDSDSDAEPVREIRIAGKHGKTRSHDEGDGAERAGGRDEKRSWRVQVGQFVQENPAEKRLAQALKMAPFAFRNAKGAVMTRGHRGKKLYIAYFSGLTKQDADLACQSLRRKKMECSPAFAG